MQLSPAISLLVLGIACSTHAAPFVYVTQQRANGTVAVIDVATNSVAATIAVGACPWRIVIDKAGARGYVANRCDNSVSVLDLATNTVASTFATPVILNSVASPGAVALSTDESRLFVSGSLTAWALDSQTGVVLATIPLPATPQAFAKDPLSSDLYVLYFAQPFISKIDTVTNTVSTQLTSRPDLLPTGFDITADGSRLYIANAAQVSLFIPPASDAVTVVQTSGAGPVETISLGDQAADVVVSRQAARAYGVAYSHLRAIDTSTNAIIGSAPIPPDSIRGAIEPTSNQVFVTNYSTGVVTVVDGSTLAVLATIPVPFASAVAVKPASTITAPASVEPVPTLTGTLLASLGFLIVIAAAISLRS